MNLYVREQFGMAEAQPLTYKNVMFTFICCGIGIIVALVVAMIEFVANIWKANKGKFKFSKNEPLITISCRHIKITDTSDSA